MIAMLFLSLLSFLCVAHVSGLNPVIVKGYKFFDSVTGEEIVVKGIDYYPRANTGPYDINSYDFFSNKHRAIWERDIPYLKGLGINALRLYSVDPKEDHSEFMNSLNEAGIYALVAVTAACPTCAVTRAYPPECYPNDLKTRGQGVINEFVMYNNTLAISTGNEVNLFTPIGQPQVNAPCQKKFLRDMREYLAGCPHLRQVPIGLVSADYFRGAFANYYNCQENPNDPYEFAEWYGLNSYVFCNGNVSHFDKAPGFIYLAQSFQSYDYSIPVMLTEFGCLSPTFKAVDGYQAQRNFLQAKWLITEDTMRDQFVGGFAFEYSMEAANAGGYPFKVYAGANWGIGYFSPARCDDIKINCTYNPIPSYYNLQAAYKHTGANLSTAMDKFVIPKHRTGRTQCPSWIPGIANYTWETDKIAYGKCPAVPVAVPSPTLSSPIATSSSAGIPIIVVVIGVGIVAVAVAAVFVLRRKEEATKEVTGSSEEAALVSNGGSNGYINGNGVHP